MKNTVPVFKNAVLLVKDIFVSKEFYCRLLHQEVDFDYGKSIGFKSGIALWQLPDDHPVKKKSEGLSGGGFELYFESENFDRDHQQVIRANVKLLHDVVEESWGQRTMRFYDPDGHLVELGESLPAFVRRMAKTMTIGQISLKSSIPEEQVRRILKP